MNNPRGFLVVVVEPMDPGTGREEELTDAERIDRILSPVPVPPLPTDGIDTATTAVHEAGHAIVAADLLGGENVRGAVVRTPTSGTTLFVIPSVTTTEQIFPNLWKQAAVMLAGVAAEMLYLRYTPDEPGTISDLVQAQRICSGLTRLSATLPKAGVLPWEPAPRAYGGMPLAYPRLIEGMRPSLAANAIRSVYDHAYQLLWRRRAAFRRIAEQLYRERTIRTASIAAILAEEPAEP